MDFKKIATHGAHAIWTRKSAVMGLKGVAALALGRWAWGKWQERSKNQTDDHHPDEARPVESKAI